MRLLKAALLAVCLLPLSLSAQVYNTIVENRTGQPISGASIAVCTAVPPSPLSTSSPCGSNSATLYTDQTLNTPAATNVVTTDAYGNAVLFAQPGVYWTVTYGYLINPHQNVIAVPSGSGGTPHNLLSSTHPDTVPYTPPVLGDLVIGNGSGKWAAVHANNTASQYCLISQGDGADVTSIQWGACPGGSPIAVYAKDNSVVGQQPELNFLTTASVIPTVTNDSGSSRVNVSFTATTEVAPPPPFSIPTGQAVAWAYPTTCTPTGTPDLGSVQCGTTSGIVDRKVSCPLCDTNMGQTWSDFIMPTLPNDAAIQGIYGVMVTNRTTTPMVVMDLRCNTTFPLPVGGATTKWSGEYSTASMGTATTVVTAGSCAVNSAASTNLGTFGDDIVNTQLVAMAIYYTTATPPNQVAVPLFIEPFYPSVIGVTPTFNVVSDASPISWNLNQNFIQNGIVSLSHSTSTRALNVTNMQNGGIYRLAFVQDSTGGASVTLGSGCTWIVNNSPVSTLNIPLAANAVSEAEIAYDGTYCYVDLTQASSGSPSLANAGLWEPSPTSYIPGQIVSYNSCSWIGVASSSGVAPGSDNGVDWTLLACNGTNGTSGTNGTNGADGAPGAPGYSPNQVISGGGVAWTGSGLNFVVSPTTYLIGGVQYSCPLTGLTDSASDPTLDRIDAVICDKTGVASFVTGTPSATPVPPAIDITSQLQLTFVYVAAAATAPSNVSVTDIYHENAEWTCAVSGGTVVCNSSSTPHSGSLNIKYTAAATGAYSQQTIPSGTVDLGTFNAFNIWVKNDTVQPITRSLILQWFNGTTARCSPVTIQSGNFGFDVTKTTWQQLNIPTSVFACGGIPVTRIRETVGGTGTNLTIHLDDITLQGGLNGPVASVALVPCGEWNSATAYAVNCEVEYATTGSSYRALQANTNKVPTNATNWKPLDTHGPAGVDGNIQVKSGAAFSSINTTVSGSDVTFPGILFASQFQSTDLVDNTVMQFLTGSGGDSTCTSFLPSATNATLCIKSGIVQEAKNGGVTYYPLATTTGSTTTDHCAKFDANGNVVDAGATCGTGSGTVTTVTGTPPVVSSGGTTPAISCPTCAIGPGSSTTNHLAKFSGTDGLTLADGGAIPTGTVTSVATTSPITGGTITGTGTIACATCVTSAASLTSGQLIAGAGSQASAVTNLTGAVTTSGGVATTLDTRYGIRDCEIVIGDPGSASPALANDNDTPAVCANDFGADYTITAVSCTSDGGSPTVTPILSGGTGTSIVTGAITCGTQPTYVAGTVNGTPTVHSFSANGATCSSTPCTVDGNITAAGGTAKYIVIKIKRAIVAP
jgi:hypothetical protein